MIIVKQNNEQGNKYALKRFPAAGLLIIIIMYKLVLIVFNLLLDQELVLYKEFFMIDAI